MLKRIIFPFLIIHCQLSIVNCSAQQYHFRTYSVQDGMGSSSTNHIFQDSKGYVWFATQGGGASRFNGSEFKNFTKADGLIGNDATYIAEDKNHHVWIATSQGASRYDGQRFTNFDGKNGLTDGIVFCIYPAKDGKLWFATKGDGVRIWDGKKFQSITKKHGLPSNEVYSIQEDAKGGLWFGLDSGLTKYANGKFTDYTTQPLTKGQTYFSSLKDKQGNLWFGSVSGKVVVITPDGTLTDFPLPETVNHDFIGGMAQDSLGNIWMATDHGLLKIPLSHGRGARGEAKPSEAQLFGHAEGLSADAIQAIMADYEGNIWAGTAAAGVNILSSEVFLKYTPTSGLFAQNITAICPSASNDKYYVGTATGLYIYNSQSNNKFQSVLLPPTMAKANISSLSLDKQQRLWIAEQGGIYVMDKAPSVQNDQFRITSSSQFSYPQITFYEKIKGQEIYAPQKIIHDSKGNTWVATYGSGVLFFGENGQKEMYTPENGFPSYNVFTVIEDSRHNLWFGTQDAGAIKWDGKKFIPLAHIPDKAIWSIAEDDKGNMYFGTGESGLFRFDGNSFKHFTTQNGLSSDYLPVMYFDKEKNCLWLAGEKGLDRMDLSSEVLNKNQKSSANQPNHASHSPAIRNYNQAEGFRPTTINPNAILTKTDGSLLVGTVNGLWQYNPDEDRPITVQPKIELSGVRLFYQKADWKPYSKSLNPITGLPENLVLPYNKNHLTFDIQTLTSRDVLYTFQLEGQDDKWSNPTKNKEITYTNLSPGQTYTFRAKAITEKGRLSSGEISFSFVIHPPWWQTWWFHLLAFGAFVVTLISFIKTRERILKQQNADLEKKVKQRTTTIEQQKLVVEKTLGEKELLLKEIHHRVKNNLQTISSMLMLQGAGLKDENAKKAIAESQSRVKSIALVHQKLYQTDGLEKIELGAFVQELTDQVKMLFRNAESNVSIKINIPETYLLIDKAIPLGLILNELLTNSFKYAFTDTQEGKIEISLLVSESNGDPVPKEMKLIYRDNGPGIESNESIEKPKTLGLKIVKLLSQQIGGGGGIQE